MLSLHPRSFVFSFAGAAVFALATVVSSFAIRWVIDNVILPRFEDGQVAVGTFFAGIGMIIGIGLVRAIGVVFRRAFASAGMWRVAETYTNQVLDRLVCQPVSWHRRYQDGDLVARAGVDTETTVSVIAPIPFATSTVLMIVISTIWLLIIDIPLGIVALIVFPLVIATNVCTSGPSRSTTPGRRNSSGTSLQLSTRALKGYKSSRHTAPRSARQCASPNSQVAFVRRESKRSGGEVGSMR